MIKHQVESEIRERNSKIMKADEHKKLIEEHILLAEKVHHLLRSDPKKNSIVRSDLLEAIRQDQGGIGRIDERSCCDQLVTLTKIVPQWISLYSLPAKTLIKCANKAMQTCEIHDHIKLHFNELAKKQAAEQQA